MFELKFIWLSGEAHCIHISNKKQVFPLAEILPQSNTPQQADGTSSPAYILVTFSHSKIFLSR